MSYELISFDLDGTLVDSASEIAEAANRALEIRGLERFPAAEIAQLIGQGTRELMLKLLQRAQSMHTAQADRVQAAQLIAAMDEQYAHVVGTSAVLYDGCREALASIRSAGVRVACVTNKEMQHVRRLLRAMRLEGYFDLVIGGDSLVEKKPHASVLRHAARALGADTARSAHVGDSAIDVAAAHNSGFAAWAVTYGYNAGIPVTVAKPDRIFTALLEVAELVLLHRRQ